MPLTRSSRDVGVDAVRGIALVSMFVAHGVPYAAGDVWVLSDFLTAALFATLVGVGAGMSSHKGLAAPFVRGLVLVVLGLLLEQAGSQVVVILVQLGVLTWVIALLRPLPSWLLGVLAAVIAMLAPRLQSGLFDVYADLFMRGDRAAARVLDVLFVGHYYRVATMTVWAILGMLAARHLLRHCSRRPAQAILGAGCLLGAGVVYATATGVTAYSGTLAEILLDGLLALGVLLLGAWLADRLRVGLLAQMGQMSLTIYTLQVLWLAFLNVAWFHGRNDDSWWTFGSLLGGALLLAWGWSRIPASSALTRGPLETGTDGLVALVRR